MKMTTVMKRRMWSAVVLVAIAGHQGIDALGFNAREVDSFNSFRTKVREQFAMVKTVLDVCLLRTRPKFLGPRIGIGDGARVGGAGASSENEAS